MLTQRLVPLLVFLTFPGVSNISSAVDITQGMMLANSCAACHGTGGKSPGAIPSINGKSTDFLFQALIEFQNGSRLSTVMGRHAKGYSKQELRLIAEFFSQQ